jgi:hypothetical protein
VGLKIATKTEQLGLRGMTKMYGRIQEKVQERQEKTAGPDDGTSKQGTTDTLVEEKYAENSRREPANGNWPVQHT